MSDKKKFFFDVNNFDEPEDEGVVEEEEVPPPPTFSEEELEAAKNKGYEQGKQDGKAEALQSLEQQIASLLEQMGQGVQQLETGETAREKRYEEEAVALNLKAMQKIFPIWCEQYGLDEISGHIRTILGNVSASSEIVIEVAPDLTDEISSRTQDLRRGVNNIAINVQANESLGPADFRMSWADGGAVRDAEALSEQILQGLQVNNGQAQEALADTPDNGHNEQKEEVG